MFHRQNRTQNVQGMKMGNKERAGFESGLCEEWKTEKFVGDEIKVIFLSEHGCEVKDERRKTHTNL
jgi:hypothetical protein